MSEDPADRPPEGQRKPPYVVDTNIFMDWQARHYPPDVFASLVSSIDNLGLMRRERWRY